LSGQSASITLEIILENKIMKFPTQHLRVPSVRNGYILHRDGNVTWKTTLSTSAPVTPYDVVEHTSVAQAKALLGQISSTGRKG
jgi:hypothetical protein